MKRLLHAALIGAFVLVASGESAQAWVGFFRLLDDAADAAKAGRRAPGPSPGDDAGMTAGQLLAMAADIGSLAMDGVVALSDDEETGEFSYRLPDDPQSFPLREEDIQRFAAEGRRILIAKDQIPLVEKSILAAHSGLVLHVVMSEEAAETAVILDGRLYKPFGDGLYQQWRSPDLPSYAAFQEDRMRPSEAEVLSFFDSAPSTTAAILRRIEDGPAERLLVVVGAIEGRRFIREGMEGEARLGPSLAEIERAARKNHRSVLLLGLGPSGEAAGISSVVKAIEADGRFHTVLATLAKVVNADLTLSVASPETRLAITARPHAAGAEWRMIRLIAERRPPTIGEVLEPVAYLLLALLMLGFLVFLLNCRTLWAKLEPMGRPAVGFLARTTHRLKHGFRFLVFGPLYGTFYLLPVLSLLVLAIVVIFSTEATEGKSADPGIFVGGLAASIGVWAYFLRRGSIRNWGLLERIKDAVSVYLYSFGLVGVGFLVYYWDHHALGADFDQSTAETKTGFHIALALILSYLIAKLQNAFGARPYLLSASVGFYLLGLVLAPLRISLSRRGRRAIFRSAFDVNRTHTVKPEAGRFGGPIIGV